MSRRRISLRQELPLLVWLVIVWGALWQDFSPGNLLFGALLSVAVARRCYLPPGERSGRFTIRDADTILVVDGHEDGFFLGPTLFDNVTTDMSIYTDEIFGPVL